MKIYRTYDGRSFEISQPLTNFQTKDDLFDAISLTTGISSDDIICMTNLGQQINEDVLDDMQDASTQNPDAATEFYVFHRQFLYTDLEPLVAELSELPELEAPLEEAEVAHPPTPRSLSSLIDWCDQVLNNITSHDNQSWERLQQLSVIHRSASIALSNLVSHSNTVRETARILQDTANKELKRMQGLLNGHENDLKILTLVQISPKLLTSPDPSKPRPKERTLGDYVSPSKMGAVFYACNNVHNDLEENLRILQNSEMQMNDDTEGLRNEVYSTVIVPSQETYEESRQALIRAGELHAFIRSSCSPDAQGWSAAAKLAQDETLMKQVDEAVGEFILLDEVARESVRRLIADKNDMMSRCLHLLSDISSLQSDYAELAIDLNQLDADFKSNRVDGFRHLARLKNMLWAYGSTLIEIQRRSRFEMMFLNRSQALAEVMANLTESERRRRGEFRSQVVGALPWEVKGMSGNTPSLEISAGKDKDEEDIDIDQSDVDELFETLDHVASKLADQGLSAPVEEVKTSLRLLVSKMDEAEAEFVKLVETGLLGKPEDDSGSDNDSPRRQVKRELNGNGSILDKSRLEREMQDLRIQNGEKERAMEEAHDQQMAALQAELSRWKSDYRHLECNFDQEKSQHEEIRKQLEGRIADAEVEGARRLSMEDELSRLRRDLEDSRRAEVEAKAEIGEEVDRANDLEAHLHDLQIELEEAKDARNDASSRIEALLSKDISAEKQLSKAQERIDELSNQLSMARVEERKAKDAQYEIEQARDRALRNYRVEADGDRAILEETLRSQNVDLKDLQERLRRKDREAGEHGESVKNLQGQLAAADEAHEELVRQLESSKEATLEAELLKRQAERNIEAVVEKTGPLMRRLVEVHNTLRDAPALSTSSSKNAIKSVSALVNKDPEQEVIESKKQEAINAFQTAGDFANLDIIIELISSFSRAGLLETATAKLESLPQLCKKWIRAYKHSNEKLQKQQLLLREKITFRNFSIGDLALFLPTKNNSGKPWAAFNINFPHFFLNFAGNRENELLRDSLQNKEWIVARITKIEGRVASAVKNGEAESLSNPFQLAEGVKFYLLDVEGWNNANSNVAAAILPRRKSTNNPTTLANTMNAEDNSIPPAPALKRWESSPQTAFAQRQIQTQQLGGLEVEAIEEIGDAPTKILPEIPQANLIEKERPDIAILSTSTPASTQAKEREAPAMTISRASSPSGIALSLRNRSVSPEMSKKMPKSANEIVEAGFTRWPSTPERQQQRYQQYRAKNSGGRGEVKVEPSSDSSTRRVIERVTPAFGRRKQMGSALSPGATSTNMQQSRSAGESLGSSSQEKTFKQQTMPVNVAKRSVAIVDRVPEDSPNPFSASPAPASADTSEMKDYFTARKRTSSRLKPSPAEEAQSIFRRGSSGIEIEGVESSRNRRTSSSSSAASTFRPQSLLSSPRVRAAPVLSPNTEPAQGHHNLNLQPSPPSSHTNGSANAVNITASALTSRGGLLHAGTLPRNTARRLPSSSSSWVPSFSLGRKSGVKLSDEYKGDGIEEGFMSASQSLRRLADARDV